MITVNVRKQGGAAIITIPSDILRVLDIEVGTTLELDITQDGFIAHRANPKTKKRYSLKELLKRATPKNLQVLKNQTEWSRSGKSVGRELT